jgi:lipid II:glycine glycyltransferase (peptidoglycan interpeptide bridge formation enzyme)
MFIYRSRFLTRGEVWFDEEPDDTPVDWIYYRQRPAPIARASWRYTRLIDLAKSPTQLLAEMDEKTVRKIEDAEKSDHTRWERCEAKDAKIMDAVERMWNESAAVRKSAPLDRAWLDKLIEAGALDLTVTKDTGGGVLTGHLTYVGKKRAQDLIAVSTPSPLPNRALRNRINRANCLGHWQTMLALKARGIRHYDFGGWYPGTTDLRYLGMNAFKKGFGGEVVRECDCEEIRTLKGWVVLTTARMLARTNLLDWIGSRPAGHTSQPENSTHATAKNCEISPAF